MENVRYVPGNIGTRAMHSDLPADDDDKYWIRVSASNPELDRHNSIMDLKTTLKNFEADAKSRLGVALTDHHAYRSFGYGRSSDARLTDKNELLIDFYILKNMEYEGGRREFRTSEMLIRAIENALVNQVSVEFYGAREICNLCQLPIRRSSWYDDWDSERDAKCSHKMGKKYDVGNSKMETATYTVFDARLKAVSLVEFGSNRETSIDTKREVAAALAWVFAENRAFREVLCSSRNGKGLAPVLHQDARQELLPLQDPRFSESEKPGPAFGAAFSDRMRTIMEEQLMTDQEWIAKLRDALEITSIRSTDEPDAVVQKLESEVSSLREQIETQKDDIADLQVDAADGKAYREARIEEAIKQGTRAHGDAFDEAYHREYYADLPMDKLNAAIENNKKIGDAALPEGRSTTDTHEPPSERAKASVHQRKRRGRRR